MQLERIIDLFDAEIVSFQPAEPKIILKFSEPLPHGLLSTAEQPKEFQEPHQLSEKPSGGVRKTWLDRLRRVG